MRRKHLRLWKKGKQRQERLLQEKNCGKINSWKTQRSAQKRLKTLEVKAKLLRVYNYMYLFSFVISCNFSFVSAKLSLLFQTCTNFTGAYMWRNTSEYWLATVLFQARSFKVCVEKSQFHKCLETFHRSYAGERPFLVQSFKENIAILWWVAKIWSISSGATNELSNCIAHTYKQWCQSPPDFQIFDCAWHIA